MNATLSKKLRFSDVVYAIGSTPKAVRLWLQRGLVEIHTPKPEGGGWTEYSFRDIAILALVRSLVNFGVDVATSSSIANTIMGGNFFDLMNEIRDPENMTAGALALPWANRRLYLYRDGDDWKMKLASLWESDMVSRAHLAKALPHRAVHPSDAVFDPGSPSGIAALRREHEPAPAYISIDVESVLRTAFERAIAGSAIAYRVYAKHTPDYLRNAAAAVEFQGGFFGTDVQDAVNTGRTERPKAPARTKATDAKSKG